MKRKLLGFTKSILLVLLLFAALPAFSAKIYFKNTLGWTNVYVYTYSSAYWNSNGSGSQNIQSGPTKMTLVSGESDIYECTIDKTFTIVSFTKDSQSGYGNFHNTEACYRGDYREATPMFTPDKSTTQALNATTYYNEGTWSAYTTSSTYTPVLDNANEISCFYEVGSNDYSYIYVWNDGTKYAGDWPGTQMTQVGTTAGGKKIYKWTYTGSEKTISAKVIFTNKSDGNTGTQTENLDFKNHGYYIDGTWNREITAVAETKYTVNIVAGAGGSVSPSGDQQVGSTAFNISASPNTGYSFSGWTKTGGVEIADENAESTTITATSPGTVTANFKANTSSTTYYLVGDNFGGWSTSSGKAFDSNGQVTVNFDQTYTGTPFKILSSDEKWYGINDFTFTSTDRSNTLSTGTGNAKINLDRTGNYTFKMTKNADGTITLNVTYPTVTATLPTNLKFQSDAEDAWASKTMEPSDGNTTWTYELDMSNSNKEVVWFRFIDETNTNACVLANSNGVEVPADDNAHNVAYLKSSSTTHNFKFYTMGATKYTIVAKQVEGTTWSVTITPSGEKTSYVLNCGNASYSPSQSGNVYTFTLPKSAFTSNLSFNIAKTSSTTTTYLGASSNTLTGHNNEALTITSEDNSTATNFTYTASSVTDVPSGDITVTYDATNTTLKLYYVSQDELLNKSYYVVFPDANVGNTARADKTVRNIPENHTAFRLIPSRNRNAKTLDEDLLSINLKIDGGKGRQLRYDTDGKIKFYITDGKGKYLTGSGVSGNEDNLSLTSANANNGVDGYVTRNGSVSTGLPGYYYTISENSAIDAKSLTFMFAKDNTREKEYLLDDKTTKEYHTNPNSVDGFKEGEIKTGNLIVGFLTSRGYGSVYYTQHISKGVYLVGQMNGVKYTHDKKYPMKQILYPLGTTDEAKADSIVYSCTVKKGSANWDDFFLSFSTGDKVEDGNKLWNLLLRPSVQNQMDGQALEGGVTFFKNNEEEDNTQQALNPLLSDAQKNRYVSYTIYFNATYSTYRLEFHDGFYIAGAAVSESGSYEPDKRIAMSSAELNGVQHYIYTGEFKNGEQFAFFLNEDSYAVNYCEDNQPVSSTTATDAWNVQAPEGGADYAFYNHVLYNENGDNDEKTLGTGKSGMTWGLPTGTYTIRFYNHKEAKNNNQLYTVDKEVTMAHITSTFKDSQDASDATVHNYGGWRTLSDDCALILPYGIKAYYAAKVGNGKVYLKELTEGYIPAHCPVILSNPNLLARSKSITFPVCPDNYAKKLANTETNYLVDCYDKAGTVDPVVTGEDSKTKYNYFFSYRFKFEGSRVMSDVPLGFWKPFAGTATKKNYSYLSIDTELKPSQYKNNTFTYDENETVVSTKAYCFRMVFDEDDLDDNTTTGIEKVTDNADVDMKNAVWYNMQGVRISKPAAPGMYICNGKKIVVR